MKMGSDHFEGRMKSIGLGFTLTVLVACTILTGNSNRLITAAMAESSQASATGPHFTVDPSWPKPLPDEWVTGEVGGTCIDAHDHVFIANRRELIAKEQQTAKPAPPIIEFDPDGKIVNSWGDPGTLPKNIHGCFVDYEGNIWVAGNEDAIVQKYTHDGSKLLLQIGTKGVFDTSDGTLDGEAMNSSHTLLNKPAGVAVDPGNGDVYIADGYANRRVAVFDRGGHFLRQWGQQGTSAQAEAGAPGVFLKAVHCVIIGNDNLVYVCDRQGDRIEVFDKMGKFERNIFIKKGTGALKGVLGSAWWIAFSPDQTQKYLYVSDSGNERVWIMDHATGQLLSSFGRHGHQTGEFTYLHTIAVDSKGNIISGETISGRRVQKFKLLSD
jgi:DNA-binding beta-propeller fold protein YncE